MLEPVTRPPPNLVAAGVTLVLVGVAPTRTGAQVTPAPPVLPVLVTPVSMQVPQSPDGSPPVEGMSPTEATQMMAMEALPPEIVVTGSRLRRQTSLVASGAVLAGDALAERVRPTIGETLAHLPGVSSTAFGPSASRPVLRGFQGERGRLLIEGVGTLDVSNTSPDHAVALNPLVADRIEVLRGPSALLYASGSSGGVVNTVSGRIARRLPDGVEGVTALGYGSAATEATAGGRIDAALGGPFAIHVDGQFLRGDPVETGGFVLAPIPRAMAAGARDRTIGQLAQLRGVLPGSGFQTWEAAGGASAVFADGHAGFSVSNYASRYGLPTRFSLDPATPQPDTYIDLNQLRIDGRFELDLADGPLRTLRGRFAWADYRHFEEVRGGARSATFLNLGYEGRIEAVFGRGRWRTTLGAQYYDRDFRVLGAAPLLPPSCTRQYALFAVHDLDLGRLKLEGAVRYERSDVSAEMDVILQNRPLQRGFGVWSLSGGANVALLTDWTLAANASYFERAPVVEELLTQGIDPGTQGQLTGNPALPIERSWTFEAILRGQGGWGSATISAYYADFSTYIFPAQTAGMVQGLPIFAFAARPARYWGLEAQARLPVAQWRGLGIATDMLLDYTEATLAGGEPVPRIPPLRMLGGVSAEGARINARAEIEWTTPQSRSAPFETPTRGFVMVNLPAGWKPLARLRRLELRLSLNNLLDAEARRHASFLKDFAPLAGRDVRLTARIAL